MTLAPTRRQPYALAPLAAIALVMLVVHVATNAQYGFHRDELATVADARHLAWGYVVYPPLTAFFGRISIDLWGATPRAIRVFPAIAESVIVMLTGFMAAELGATRRWQIVAALAALVAPIAVVQGALFQYVSFDALWWVATAYFVIRVLRSENPHWWLAVGVTVGLGMMTKYTMAFFAVGLLVGLLLTPARRYLANRWLWIGVAISLLIFLPHLVWEARHDWITLTFLQHIHVRDVSQGRANGFLVQQLFLSTCVLTVPLWLGGLYYLLFEPGAVRFRAVAWMYIVPLLILTFADGRFYYLAPAYPMLLAAGAVAVERWLAVRAERASHVTAGDATPSVTTARVVIGILSAVAIASIVILPIGAVHSTLWKLHTEGVDHEYSEEIGWPELVRTVASVYDSLPPAERARTSILAGNYGEAGALDVYGPARHLPQVISEVDSYFARGYGSAPPESAIVLGYDMDDATMLFDTCRVVAHVTNSHGIVNEETRFHPDVLLCTGPSANWPERWEKMRRFG